ncbi:MAG: PAS domain-containing protein, partial [Pseudomonadota bacterium]
MGQRLEPRLNTALASSGTSVYRMARAAAAGNGTPTAFSLDGKSFRLSAWRADNGSIVWRFDPGHDSPAPLAETRVEPPLVDPVQMPEAHLVIEQLPVALLRLDTTGRIRLANKAARMLLGAGNADEEAGPSALDRHCLPDLLEGLGKNLSDWISETVEGRHQGRAQVARGRVEGIDGFADPVGQVLPEPFQQVG